MIKVKTSGLIGPALDWVVAKCEGVMLEHSSKQYGCIVSHNCEDIAPTAPGYGFSPSINWSQSGPIIDREKIEIYWHEPLEMWASRYHENLRYGPTPLIAAMRCFCASRLGEEVEIPEELL